MMIKGIKLPEILIIFLVFGFGAGCDQSAENKTTEVFSYELDIIAPGIFNGPSHTMTLNEWFYQATERQVTSYDQWTANEKVYLYRDETLKTVFNGNDIVNENTIVWCNFSLNNSGAQIGNITGSITLTGISNPAPKVWIFCYNNSWWQCGKVDMSDVSGTGAAVDWSIPVYKRYFKPNLESRFGLHVLPPGAVHGYDVSMFTRKTITGAEMDTGSLGEVSIRGVTLSGIINVTHNGNPVPHVEIYSKWPVQGFLNNTYLSSPGADALWSMVLYPSTVPMDIIFRVIGATKKEWASDDKLFDITLDIDPVWVIEDDVSGIVLDLGDMPD